MRRVFEQVSGEANFFALLIFAFVSSITPGPNNLMLLASGVNFGVRRTVPHTLGVTLGFSFMVLLLGLGLGQVFTRFPVIYSVLKIIGAGYLLWLAWKIANAGPMSHESEADLGQPLTFWQAAAFQWVNPKAWIMGVTAVSTYVLLANPTWNAIAVALTFGITNLPSVGVWVLFGAGMRRVLSDPVRVRIFNRVMAALLVASLWPLVADFFR